MLITRFMMICSPCCCRGSESPSVVACVRSACPNTWPHRIHWFYAWASSRSSLEGTREGLVRMEGTKEKRTWDWPPWSVSLPPDRAPIGRRPLGVRPLSCSTLSLSSLQTDRAHERKHITLWSRRTLQGARGTNLSTVKTRAILPMARILFLMISFLAAIAPPVSEKASQLVKQVSFRWNISAKSATTTALCRFRKLKVEVCSH